MNNFIIREAVKEDCKEIRRLIQELADFEKMPNGPQIDTKVLEDDGFNSEHPIFGCIVAEVDGENKEMIGYALYFIAYSTWMGKAIYLEDIYVSPQFRSQGLGSKLFDTIAKKGLELGCCRMDFRVLNWNPANEFYARKGAVDMTRLEGWHHYSLNKANMEKLTSKTTV
ncbi:thialysine N-epsilon-acetyltransferase [Ischnura elegans]|uniref:thialysine N-epsilon-acetyltransferase n=1 Tax=Ischnura elegans TaxID=197161 RepID=UPI001ED86EB2|nr:thialysine N-epsilon-acetyltransferase [Ischnura elegans]